MNSARSLLTLGTICSFAFALATLGAQDPAKKSVPRGRLPAHYKDLVSPDQREEIYAIQSKYNTEIEALEAKIEKLKKDRDAEVSKVLTPAQQARLKLLIDGKDKAVGAAKAISEPPAAGDGKRDAKDVFPK